VSNEEAPSSRNVATLELAWTFQPDGSAGKPIVHAGPVMRAPYVYVAAGSGERRVYALDLATGKQHWATKLGAAGVLVADRDVLLLRSDGRLWRYVPRSGHLVWRRPAWAGSFESGWPASPVVTDGIVSWLEGGSAVAYDAKTARPLWTRELGCFNCDLAAAGGHVFLAGVLDDADPESDVGGRLYALDARTGKTLWSAGAAGSFTTGASPVVAGGRVFVRTMSGGEGRRVFSIEAFRAADGKHLWHAAVGVANGFWFTPPAANATLVVHPSEDGFLYALDAATGSLRWRAKVGLSGSTPALVNGIVWIGDDTGHLVAFDARNGRALWHSGPFTIGDLATQTPAQTGTVDAVVAGGYVLVATAADGVRAYRVVSP